MNPGFRSTFETCINCLPLTGGEIEFTRFHQTNLRNVWRKTDRINIRIFGTTNKKFQFSIPKLREIRLFFFLKRSFSNVRQEQERRRSRLLQLAYIQLP